MSLTNSTNKDRVATISAYGKIVKTATTANNIIWPAQISSPNDVIKYQKDHLGRLATLKLMKSPLASKLILQIVGSWAFIVGRVLNTTRVLNRDTFNQELRNNELKLGSKNHHELVRSPLVTISNHISCIDDPVLWGSLLPLSYYCRKQDFVRWSAAAREICFTKGWHSVLFSLGKTFPIDRGHGVYQPAMDFALGLLRHNQWLHFFPEGKVMRDQQNRPITNLDRGYKFKWGLARLIIDYLGENRNNERIIRILPFYHLGLDQVLPIGRPYVPRVGKQITIYFRTETINLNLEKLERIIGGPLQMAKSQVSDAKDIGCQNRTKLIKYLEAEMEILKVHATEHHNASG